MELSVEFTFAAAHRLMKYNGPCFHLHGHNYTLFVTVSGEPDAESGLILDFHDLEMIVQSHVLTVLDHRYLNDTIENPTAEEIIRWIWRTLEPALPNLSELKLYEMPRYFVSLKKEQMKPSPSL